MINYSINKYFTPKECSDIIEYCMDNGDIFKYNPNEHWDCRRIYTNEFKENIISKFNQLHVKGDTSYWFDFNTFDIKDLNVSLTRYYDGRFLNLHKDTISQFTTVIVLTDEFVDGRFVLSNRIGNSVNDMRDDSTKINLELGCGISFDGSKVLHGVMPVYSGIRCALNVWMSNTDYTLKNNKTLI